MKKLYIKFEEGNQESLDKAVRIAEGLGYRKFDMDSALDFEGSWILELYEDWDYLTTGLPEESLIVCDYTEYKPEQVEQADRYNNWKANWHLVSFDDIEPMVRVLEYWAEKYSENNWKKGFPKNKLLDCAQRHLIALYEWEEVDEESKQSHAAHVMCNMMMYLYHNRNDGFIWEKTEKD